jgi:FtsZ-binding cell division protein ZapB
MGILGAVKWLSIITAIGLILAALNYVSGLRADIVTAENNNQKLNTAITVQQAVIDQQTLDVNEIKETNNTLMENNVNLQKDIDSLNTKFNVAAGGQSRDFGGITRAKPKLIEKIVNKATSNVMRCFELSTGAQLIEGEKNSECQELIDSL